MLSQNLMEKILDYAVSHGADFAEIFCEDVRRSNLTVLGEKILNSSSGKKREWASACLRGWRALTCILPI